MLANRNVYQFLHCWNALEIVDNLFISGLFDKIYVNEFSHVSQDGIFRGYNVTSVIPDGNYIIRGEENLSANTFSTTTSWLRKHSCNNL